MTLNWGSKLYNVYETPGQENKNMSGEKQAATMFRGNKSFIFLEIYNWTSNLSSRVSYALY